MSPKVAVIIVNWNGLNDTISCLNSLFRINYQNYEAIVVDNGSTGSDVEELRRLFGDRIVLFETFRNLGFAKANNIGIKYALKRDFDYVLLLNNDTEVDSDFLKELVNVAESDDGIGLVGPKMYFADPSDVLWFAGAKLNWYLGHFQRGDGQKDVGRFNNVAETDYIPGACILVKRSVLCKIGGLPTEYFLGWEDIDFCVNARRHHFMCIYVPTAKIWHKLSASFKRGAMTGVQVTYGIRNRIMIRWKYLSRLKFFFFLFFFISFTFPLHLIVYALLYRDLNRIAAFIEGLKEGFSKTIGDCRTGSNISHTTDAQLGT